MTQFCQYDAFKLKNPNSYPDINLIGDVTIKVQHIPQINLILQPYSIYKTFGIQ